MNKSTLSLLADISPYGALVATIIFAAMFVVAAAFAIYFVMKLNQSAKDHKYAVEALYAQLLEKDAKIDFLEKSRKNAMSATDYGKKVGGFSTSHEQTEQERIALRQVNMQNRLEEIMQQVKLLQTNLVKYIRQTETNSSKSEEQKDLDKQNQPRQKMSPDSTLADNDETITLRKQVEKLKSENEQLRRREEERTGGYTIEDYFPEIDAAFERADSCKFNQDDPRGSFATQRQQLNEIRKCLDAYRSQRR